MQQPTYRHFYLIFCLFLFSLFSYSAPAAHPPEDTIIITNSKAWKPFSYIENGEPKGLLIDFWRLYGERSGKKIVFKLVDWQDSLDLLAQGEAQIHAGLMYSNSRAELFDFGSKLFNVQTSIYIDKHLIGVIDEELTNLKQPIGVVEGGYEQEFMKLNYPELSLITYANNALMFEAVRDQVISIFIADKQVANFYMLSLFHRPDDFISLLQLYDQPIQFAVRKSDISLLRLVEEELYKLTQGDINQIKQKWINTETQVPTWFYNTIFFSLLFVALVYIYSLRKVVNKRTLQLAIANEKLTKQVNSDVLTGLYNRRYLVDYLDQLQAHKSQKGFAFLMLDIDFFKPINDTYGHPAGDVVLTILAKRMQYCIRNNDVLARLGGEEFCVVLEGISAQNMEKISANINENISANPFKHEGEEFKVTVSIGALHIPKTTQWSSEQVFQQADKLLYQAKNNGRDQTVVGSFYEQRSKKSSASC